MGFDYLKVDVNNIPNRTESTLSNLFAQVSAAVRHCGRPMVFSICNQGDGNYQNWAPALGNLWRVGKDIDNMSWIKPLQKSQWEGVLYELKRASQNPQIAGPGHWNDADMMLVGVSSDKGRLVVMTEEEQRTNFSMWCMISSPLFIGADLSTISDPATAILTNREAIVINQDALGIQGRLTYEQAPGLQVWTKKLKSAKGTSLAVALFNQNETAAPTTLDFSKLALKGRFRIWDCWAHQDKGEFADRYSVETPPHGAHLLILR